MITRIGVAAVIIALSSAASAQTVVGGNTGKNAPLPPSTMKDLLAQGYEIKASVPNGGKFVIFMQKEQSAYACEFVSVTNSKCVAISN